MKLTKRIWNGVKQVIKSPVTYGSLFLALNGCNNEPIQPKEEYFPRKGLVRLDNEVSIKDNLVYAPEYIISSVDGDSIADFICPLGINPKWAVLNDSIDYESEGYYINKDPRKGDTREMTPEMRNLATTIMNANKRLAYLLVNDLYLEAKEKE